MALKPDRISVLGATDISYFMNEVAERGIVVIHATAGSGAAMDDANATVAIPGSGTGDPAGLLLNDVVNIDLTRQHINWHKDEVQLGGKVTLLRHGQVTTNAIPAADNPTAGDPLYYTEDGEVTTSAGSSQIGRFLSRKDADGYVKIEVNFATTN